MINLIMLLERAQWNLRTIFVLNNLGMLGTCVEPCI